jgi:hypothetical protein
VPIATSNNKVSALGNKKVDKKAKEEISKSQ